jgi:hypothetical protein
MRIELLGLFGPIFFKFSLDSKLYNIGRAFFTLMISTQ